MTIEGGDDTEINNGNCIAKLRNNRETFDKCEIIQRNN